MQKSAQWCGIAGREGRELSSACDASKDEMRHVTFERGHRRAPGAPRLRKEMEDGLAGGLRGKGQRCIRPGSISLSRGRWLCRRSLRIHTRTACTAGKCRKLSCLCDFDRSLVRHHRSLLRHHRSLLRHHSGITWRRYSRTRFELPKTIGTEPPLHRNVSRGRGQARQKD